MKAFTNFMKVMRSSDETSTENECKGKRRAKFWKFQQLDRRDDTDNSTASDMATLEWEWAKNMTRCHESLFSEEVDPIIEDHMSVPEGWSSKK